MEMLGVIISNKNDITHLVTPESGPVKEREMFEIVAQTIGAFQRFRMNNRMKFLLSLTCVSISGGQPWA
jgi:hypothetical protein